ENVSSDNSEAVLLPIDDQTRMQMSQLVDGHTDQWSQLKANHRKEIHDMYLNFMDTKRELLIKVMKDAQEEQKRELKLIHEREMKEMKAQQTKTSIESNRSVSTDKKVKNKAERDRRIRELNDYNTKRFIDQRKTQAQRHDRQNQDFVKRHAREEEELLNALKRVGAKDDLIRQYNEELKYSKKATVI
ncbi:hypothetical protein Ciccas_014206, partial [Cichlidogyrus casuarinus]